MTLTKEILEQENLVASERELVITTGCLIVEDLEKKLKNKRKRLREEFTVKRKVVMMMMSSIIMTIEYIGIARVILSPLLKLLGTVL